MSIKERLFGESNFRLLQDETILFQSTPAKWDTFSLPKISWFWLLAFIVLLILGLNEDFTKTIIILLIVSIIYTLFAMKKIMPSQKSVYIITNRRIYVFERFSLSSTNEFTSNLDDIYDYGFEYRSRLRNTGYVNFSDDRGVATYLNEHPMKNVKNFYEALEEALSNINQLEEA